MYRPAKQIQITSSIQVMREKEREGGVGASMCVCVRECARAKNHPQGCDFFGDFLHVKLEMHDQLDYSQN